MIDVKIDKLDRGWIVSLMAEGYSVYDIVKNYTITEELITECMDLFGKEIIIEGFSLSESFINKAIELEFFQLEDIKELSMSTYSNLSQEFIVEHSKFINWNRMILYISTQSDNFDKYIDIIEEHNLWSVISANDLPIDFIREWKEKLDWKYLSMVKCFTDEEKQEFSDHIVVFENTKVEEEFIDNSQFEFVSKMSNEELEELIEEINKHLGK